MYKYVSVIQKVVHSCAQRNDKFLILCNSQKQGMVQEKSQHLMQQKKTSFCAINKSCTIEGNKLLCNKQNQQVVKQKKNKLLCNKQKEQVV